MSLHTSLISLRNRLQTLDELWEQTRQGWNDPVSRDFEEHFWLPLKAQVEAVLQAADRLTPVLARAQRECSDAP
jgi:hypothetical protein